MRFGLINAVDSLIEVAQSLALDLDETKLHTRSLNYVEDGLLRGRILGAMSYFEEQTGRQLLTATRELWLDMCPYPERRIELPRPPLQSVESFTYLDADGELATFDAASYTVFAPAGDHCRRGWLELNDSFTWPTTLDQGGAVRIRYVCGYGGDDADVPELAKAVLRQIVSEWDRFRGATTEHTNNELPIGVCQILNGFKYSALPSIVPRRLCA